jgi:putative ABC transport system permease protein
MMLGIARDVRYAARQLRKQPGFAAVAVATLALGIGANAAIFSVVDAVLLEPLRYREPERLVEITSAFPNLGFDEFWISAPEYLELREWATSYEEVGAYVTTTENVAGGDEPLRATTAYLTASLFRALGVPAARGRAFTDEEDGPGADPVVVLSDALWRRAFGADPELLGETIEVDGERRTVVGVMPPGFDVADAGVEVWLPLALDPADPGGRGSHYLTLIGRLAPGVSEAAARHELAALIERWEREFPDSHRPNPEGHPFGLEALKEDLIGEARPAMLLLFGAVGLVLLIACVNVANLLLARAEGRQREIAVRTALGAGRGRLARQFLTESLLLALTGGALGLGLAVAGVRALLAAFPGAVPRAAEIGVDLRVLAFTFAASIAAGLLFGVAPALAGPLGGRGRAFATALKAGGRTSAGRGRLLFRALLVGAEVAAATVAVLCAGLLMRSFGELLAVDPGFEPRGVLTLQLELPASAYPEPRQVTAFYDRLLGEVERLPGVESAAAMTGLPPNRPVNANDTEFEGVPETDDGVPQNVDYYQVVTPGYFETMGIRLLAGRGFADTDAADGPPVVVVSETLARTFWPDQPAVGKRVRRGWWNEAEDVPEEPWFTVVGVAADVKEGGLDAPAGTTLYFLHRQAPAYEPAAGFTPRTLNLVVRAAGDDPLALAGSVRGAIRRLDPSLPAAGVRPLDEVVLGSLARQRLLSALVGLFGALALALAAVGTYGVLSYGVEQRRREIGVRLALGAGRGGILGLVVARGMRPVLAGLAAGALAAFALRRALASVLYGVSPTDPLTFVTVAGLLAAVALGACLIPGRRAARVDPLVALRYE